MPRLRRPPFPDDDIESLLNPPSPGSPRGPREFEALCRYWALRALIELDGAQQAVTQEHCRHTDMMEFLGVGRRLLDGAHDRARIMSRLRTLHRQALNKPPALPEGVPALVNLRWLQQQLALSELELRALLLCVLARCARPLSQAMHTLGELDDLRAHWAMSVLLDATPDDIATILRRSGPLARAGLLCIDSGGHYTLQGKFDLPAGFADRIFMPHADPFEIFRRNFVPAPAASLSAQQFEHLQPELDRMVRYLRHCVTQRQEGVNILIYGPPGTGKTELARTLAGMVEAQLFEVAVTDDEDERIEGVQRLTSYALSQRILASRSQAVILFDEVEDIAEAIANDDGPAPLRTRRKPSKGWFNKTLETNPVPAIFVSNRIAHIDPAHRRRFDMHLHLEVPPTAVRTRMLQEQTAHLGVSPAWCARLAQHEAMSPAMIARTGRVTAALREAGVDTQPEPLFEDLLSASLRAQGMDAVLPKADADLLEHDLDLVRTDADVHALLEGLRRSGSGRLCFHGPPGTGKTALARSLAQRLGVQTLIRRASDLLSPYVGESEQQIAQAFDSARRSRAMLIVDEADSFLASRSHGDKRNWEISLVNEFLQQMEAFPGIFIATTNLLDRMDEACLRRFDAKIEFRTLAPAQVLEMLRRAARTLALTDEPEARHAGALDALTPGDFATVLRQARLQPVRSVDDLAQRLQAEQCLRRGGSQRPVGFHARAA